jgi:hypothetical protein
VTSSTSHPIAPLRASSDRTQTAEQLIDCADSATAEFRRILEENGHGEHCFCEGILVCGFPEFHGNEYPWRKTMREFVEVAGTVEPER